jgi:hypothetical protein
MWHIPKMSANHSQERREVRKTSRESGRAAGKKIHTSMLGSNDCSTKLGFPVQAWWTTDRPSRSMNPLDLDTRSSSHPSYSA